MKKLDEILHAVNPNVPVKTYFCDGTWRTAGPSAAAAVEIRMGGDNKAFQQMIEMNNSRHYSELLTLSTQQMAYAPEWLTSYLFAGMVYVGTGDTAKAKAMLPKFDAQVGPAYATGACKQMSDFFRERVR